jgi:hypothetical protein
MVSRKGRDAVVQHALLPSDSPLEKTPHNARRTKPLRGMQ